MTSTLRPFRPFVFAVVTIFAMAVSARADSFTLLSETYRVAAHGYVYVNIDHQPEVKYDETSSTPLSHNDNKELVTSSAAGAFWLRTHSTGGMTSANLFVQADRDQGDISFALAEFADAYATITFKPTDTQYIFKTDVPPGSFFELRGYAELHDDTAASTVLSFGPVGLTSVGYPVFLNPDHVYSIKASSLGPLPFFTGVRASLTAVPETESVLVFLLFGLVAFGATNARNRWS